MGQIKMRKSGIQTVSFFKNLFVLAIVNSLFIFLTGNTPAESDCSNVTQCTANEPFWCNPTDNGICQEMYENNTCENNGGLLERQNFNEGDPPICPSGSILLSETVNNFTRYACHTINSDAGELPLIVFLPGTGTYASQAYQMTTLDEHMNDAGRKYHLLSLQARQLCIPGEAKLDDLPVLDPIRWEVSYRDPLNNDDMQYIDRIIKFFIDNTAPGRVDKKRIYVVGHSNGAAMAAFYGIQRNAWQQGFPGIAAVIQWEGADPWASINGCASSAIMPYPKNSQYGMLNNSPNPKKGPGIVLLHHQCCLPSDAAVKAWMTKLTTSWDFLEIPLNNSGCKVASASTPDPCTDNDLSCTVVQASLNHITWPSDTCAYPNNATYDALSFLFQRSLPSFISVPFPAAGEDWRTGTSYNIKWYSSGFTGNVKIDVGRPSGGCDYSWTPITANTINNGGYAWTAVTPVANDCIIRVTSLSNTSIYGDSGAFDILSTTTTSVRPTTTTTSIRPTTTTTSVRPTSTTTTSCVAPGKTSLYSVNLNGGKTPTFSWTAVTNASGYYVDVCNTVNTDCITNGGPFTGKNAGNTTSFNWGATFGPGTWYYRVNAYNNCGGTNYWTSSNVGSFTETNNAPTLGSVGVAQYASCGTHNQTWSMANNATIDTSWYIQWLGNDDYGIDKGFYSMKLHSSSTWPSNTYFTRNDSVSRCMNYYGINTDNWAWLWPAQVASSGGLYDIKLGIQDIYGTETSITYTNITLVK